MAYSTTTAYIKSQGSQSDTFDDGPHICGVIKYTCERASHDDTAVTITAKYYLGFGSYAVSGTSHTAYEVNIRAWSGTATYANTASTAKATKQINASGTDWKCTSNTSAYFDAHDTDSNIDVKRKPSAKTGTLGTFTISNWTSGTHQLNFQMTDNGTQTKFTVQASCPTYYTNGTASLSASPTSTTYNGSTTLTYSRVGGTNNAIDSWSLNEGSTVITSGTGVGENKTVTRSNLSVGTHTYTLTVVFNKQGTVTKTATVTVSKANSSFTLSPTSLTLTYPESKTFTATWTNCVHSSFATADTTIASGTRDGNVYTMTPKKVGSTTVTVNGAGSPSSNYNAPTSKSVSITVNRGTQTITTSATSGTITYPATTTTFTASATGSGSAAAGALSVSTSNSSIATATISNGTVTVTRKGYGTATITVTAAQTDQYNAATKTFSITCSKRTVTPTAPTLTTGTLTYNGSAKTLANAGSCTTGGTMYYYVGTSSTAPTFSTSTWSTSISTKTDAGTYYIFWYCYVSDTTNNTGTNINTAKSLGSRVINKAANPMTFSLGNTLSVAFSTTARTLLTTNAAANAQGTVTYALTGQWNTNTEATVSYFTFNTSTRVLTLAANTPPGSYQAQITATAAGNANYDSKAINGLVTVTVTKATNPITWGTTGSWQPTYSTSAQSTSITAPTDAQGSITYSITSQKQGSTTVTYFSVNSSTGAITIAASTPANVYTVVVRATAAGNSNYNSGYKEKTFTITEKVTIILNDNGGSGGSGSVTILYGTTAGNYPSVTRPSRTGYAFTGYYSATEGGTQWYNSTPSSVQTFNLSAPTTWYAQWSPTIRAWVKTENGWKQVTSIWIRNNAAWKQAIQIFTRNNNTWKV